MKQDRGAQMASKKIPGDRLVLGLLSAFRALVMELSKNGAAGRAPASS